MILNENAEKNSDQKPRANRLKARGHLLVQAKTIGTPMSYVLSPENASATGVLIKGDKDRNLPFSVNTILEMSLYPDAKSSQRLPCLGKVVRKESEDGKVVSYGVKIVQMDSEVAEQWKEFVKQMEVKQGKTLPTP